MKSTIKLGILVGALCGLNNLNGDVPHVFEDGEVIRAEEMNENFSSINSEITTIKTDVENNSNNNSSWSEDYTYSVKDLTPGRDRVTVLGVVYDIMQFDTVSFDDHSLFTIKFPKSFSYNYSWSDNYYPTMKSQDSINGASVSTYENRNPNQLSYMKETVSGYPASVGISVSTNHVRDTFNGYEMTRAEFDAVAYTEYRFSGSVIYLHYLSAVPTYSEEYWEEQGNEGPYNEAYWSCTTDWSDISSEKYWTWDVTTGTSDEESITSIEDFNSILNACKAAESETYLIKQRVNKYFAYTTIGISVQIALDAQTFLNLSFGFNEKNYALGVSNCSRHEDSSAEAQACEATVTPLDRNFSDDYSAQAKLPAKAAREEYIKQLLTLIDHIVISGSDSES